LALGPGRVENWAALALFGRARAGGGALVITTNPAELPFQVITLDFITKLPVLEGFNSILTITDHNCSKASILIPCNESITAEGTAELYAKHMIPHYGIL
jgi:hypothetical protein